jgi:transposase InsO family protein
VALRTARDIEEIVKKVRLELVEDEEFSGAQAICWRLEELGVRPCPSVRTINRILARSDLIRRRTGPYVPSGKKYPKLPAANAGSLHQSDFVGPYYLGRGLRFYSLNSVDLATGRCATEPMRTRDAQATVTAFWRTWTRLGIPEFQQVDNDMVFYGSARHPRGLGPLVRLCLMHDVEPWFIPLAEPWRNGVVEKFNDIWRQKFVGHVQLSSEEDLQAESLAFESRHNSRYRYSKLNGKTPIEALKASRVKLRFPPGSETPRHPLPRPDKGQYHLVRFVRSEGQFDVFGEKFRAPPECVYEYVCLTIDVANERLKVLLNWKQVDEHPYDLK